MLALLFTALASDAIDDCADDVHAAFAPWHDLPPPCKATLCREGLWCDEDMARMEQAAERDCTLLYNYDILYNSEAVLRAKVE